MKYSSDQFILANKLETAMCLSQLFIYCSVMFILPFLG
uniref:Uncharacterized protein n=1 Tax=Salmo trutta TaxID=8032 RepID=A0A674BSM7_SALTR